MTEFNSYAFIFDMDGTLVDNMHFHTRAWQQMLAENGKKVEGTDFLVKTAGKTNREIVPGIFPDASDEEIKRLGLRKEELYRQLFREHREPVDGVTHFLERSRELGIRMAVATAAPVANVEFILDGLELRQFFDAVVTAADVSHGKPDPEIFLRSAEKIAADPPRCMVFEDALNGFEAARRAGMKAVGIATVNSIDDLRKLEGVVDAHADFTGLSPDELITKYLRQHT